MEKAPQTSPGTVSKILWHFTGGPKWNAKTKKQGARPKPTADAYSSLRAIIKSQQIALGSYKEVVKVKLARRVRKAGKVTTTYRDRWVTSSAICCLSDIPAPHLRYHAHRYGKFAIGFHREAVIEAGFNPVLYALEDGDIMQRLYRGWSGLAAADLDDALGVLSSIEHDLQECESEVSVDELETELEWIKGRLDPVHKSFKDFLALTKTFSKDEFATIYCEREWRSTKEFVFEYDDVAMIVLPREMDGKDFYTPFAERTAEMAGLPRRIPIVPWDDLVEH